MHNNFRTLIIGLSFSFSIGVAVACGGDGDGDGGSFDNVGACNDLQTTLADCSDTYDGVLSCSSYDGYACDVADYFNCVNDAYGECEMGTFPNIDSAALQECAALAECS